MLTTVYQPRATLSAKERNALEWSYSMLEASAASFATVGNIATARTHARRARMLIAAFGVRIRPRVERKAVTV